MRTFHKKRINALDAFLPKRLVHARERSLKEIAESVVLIGVDLGGWLIEGLHKLGVYIPETLRPTATLLLVASLCLAAGLERATSMRKLLLSEKETSEKLDKLLLIVGNEEVEIGRLGENLHIADFLMGSPDITNAAIELLDATESDKAANDRDILATGQFFSSESDHLADAYYAKIADRVRVAHEHRGSMAYHVVLSLADPRLSEAIERRKKHFRAVGLTEDKIKFHCIESKWPFEVLIGINQAIVAFPDPDGKNPHFFALRIRDESFVAKARKWYRSIVSHYAKDYPL